jgi:hypothetical protein
LRALRQRAAQVRVRIEATGDEAAAVEEHRKGKRTFARWPVKPCGKCATARGNAQVLFRGDLIARGEAAACRDHGAISRRRELGEIDGRRACEGGEQSLSLGIERHRVSCAIGQRIVEATVVRGARTVAMG